MRRPATTTAPALRLEDVSRRFGDVVAVDGVTLEVARGELLALVGPSGCGKSTLLRLVAGLLPVDRGRVVLAGEEVSRPGATVPPERRRTGVVFQAHTLFPHLTVAANVAFGLAGRPRDDARRRVGEVLDLVGLPRHGDRYPHELSGGEAQRIALARALAPEPQLVLLDEPFASLDPNLRAQVRADTVDILRRAGATAVVVTHDQQEALATGDRVAVMRAGRLEQVDVPDVVFHAPANRFVATFLGVADFLPARAGADGLLHTEAGTCAAPPDLRDGAATIMVRPHEVRVRPDAAGAAEVVGAEFQGGFVLHTVRLPSGQLLRALSPHTEQLRVGDRVRVELAHGHPPAIFTAAAGEGAVSPPEPAGTAPRSAPRPPST